MIYILEQIFNEVFWCNYESDSYSYGFNSSTVAQNPWCMSPTRTWLFFFLMLVLFCGGHFMDIHCKLAALKVKHFNEKLKNNFSNVRKYQFLMVWHERNPTNSDTLFWFSLLSVQKRIQSKWLQSNAGRVR